MVHSYVNHTPNTFKMDSLNYEQNKDLFGRYFGDFFTYEEVEQIIEKRLREDAYDKLIEDVLREFEDGE